MFDDNNNAGENDEAAKDLETGSVIPDAPKHHEKNNELEEKTGPSKEAEEQKEHNPKPDDQVKIIYSGMQAPKKEGSGETQAQAAGLNKTAPNSVLSQHSSLKPAGSQLNKTGPTLANNPQNTQKNAVTANQGEQEVKKAKKIVLGCLGAALIVFIIFLIIVFIFVSGPADTPNPLAQLLNVNQNTFINGIISIVNLVFIILALASITATLIGFFKMSMAKKDDKITKRKGLITTITGIITFVLSLLIWVGVYMYLDSKRSNFVEENKNLPAIYTEPEDTLNLTAPVEIRFDASNVPIDTRKYQIISYLWDFDDGRTQTGQIVAYTFDTKGKNDGRYDVLLTVTKRDRQTGEEIEEKFEKVISIANVKVAAKIKADPLKGPTPLTVKFDASDSADEDGNIIAYEWDFNGDGVYDDANGAKAEHVFDKVGKYEVGLRVTDNNNEFSDTSIVIEAEKTQKPKAVISTNNENSKFEANVSYVFDAKNSKSPNGKIEQYFWNFGDGTKEETTRTVSHTFAKAGTYEVELTITDENGDSDTLIQKFIIGEFQSDLGAKIISQPPSAGASGNIEGEVPFKVTFDVEKTQFSPNIVEYQWDFDGDGKTDSFEKSASHTFQEPGTYKASLKVLSSTDEEFSTFVTVDAKEQGLRVDVKATPKEGIVPLTVDFDASGSSHPSSSIVGFEWDFGDGSNPKKSSSKISYKFTKIGTFVVSVTALGADGKTANKQVNINVLPVPLKACFEASIKEGKAPLTVQFNSTCTTGTVVKYNWNFADGDSSTTNNPTHVFEKTGTYEVTLEVSDNDNVVSKASQSITVTAADE